LVIADVAIIPGLLARPVALTPFCAASLIGRGLLSFGGLGDG
jgi:hypothetical protein